jgi:hypothetical protein
MQTFSINAASLMLEKDRRTVTRAMQGVAADEKANGQPRWKMSNIVAALERHSRANGNGNNAGSSGGSDRLAAIATELERLSGEADAAIEVVRSKGTLAAKQPHSRAAMKLIDRIASLYQESNDLLREKDPTSIAEYVTGPIIGSTFRELLAAIYGRDVEIDGVRMFPEYRPDQRPAK